MITINPNELVSASDTLRTFATDVSDIGFPVAANFRAPARLPGSAP
jgi:hypothetical protein